MQGKVRQVVQEINRCSGQDYNILRQIRALYLNKFYLKYSLSIFLLMSSADCQKPTDVAMNLSGEVVNI